MTLQDPDVKKKILAAMSEASASMTRVEAEKDLVKEIIGKLHEDHGLSKKALRKMIRVYHKQAFSKEVEEQNEFQSLYETVTGETADT